jgi:small subunit ribosomal protein S20
VLARVRLTNFTRSLTLPPATFLQVANTRSAAKRARQALRRTLHNHTVLARVRTLSKRAKSADAQANDVRALISAIDKAAKRGILHPNAAKRRKARLMRARAAKAGSQT